MSVESAMKVLTEAPIIDSKAPSSPVQGVTSTPPPKEGPKTLQEAITPVKTDKPQIGADRFAALAKKERSLQKQAADIKAREAKVKEWDSLRSQVAANPVKAMEALGITYDQLTQFLLNGQQPTADLQMKQVRDEVEALKKQQVEEKRRVQEQAKRQAEQEYQQTIQDFSSEIKDFVVTNKDNYELTNMYQGDAIVYATIEQHFANTKKIMSIKEAADLVEGYFEEQVRAAQQTKKFQGDTKPKDEGRVKAESGVKQPSPTLGNDYTSSAPSLLPAKTENDRIRRAMAALNK